MIIKKKICINCNTEQYIFSRRMCKICASKIPKKKSKLKEPIAVKNYKPTGQLSLFQAIWATRPHKCVVCNDNLKEFNVWFFSHILAKGPYKKFMLYEKNIVLKCKKCHTDWEMKGKSDLAKDPLWLPIIALHDELKTEYYQKSL